MNNVLEQISNIGMIPVISIDKEERALPLADALVKGWLPLMEVMFRTEAAAGSIAKIAKERPDFLIGAGTVLSIDQAKQAIDCGAKFLVAPGFNPKVVSYAISKNIPFVPGCVTPTEVEAALDLGVTTLKFFPAVENGGVPAMRLLSGPYPKVKFVPTGDLNRALSTEYLQFYKVAATGGDFMLKYEDIHNDNYEKIAHDVEETINEYLNFHIKHVGLNSESCDGAKQTADRLAKTLKLKVNEFSSSTFAGDLFEVMHKPFYYEKGHIAVGTRDATRAYHYLKRCGVEFIEESVSVDANNRIIAAYLKENFNGFALHLLQD